MKSKTWRLLVFVAFSGMVATLMLGGELLGWKTRDVGLMTYCPSFEETSEGPHVTYFYTGDGARDVNRNDCPKLQDVHLNPADVPFKVYAVDELKSDTAYAARAWNDRSSCPLFEEVGDFTEASIMVLRAGAPAGSNAGGDTRHRLKRHSTAEITMYNLVLAPDRQRGVKHELGHALGLAHDDYKGSIMYTGTSGSSYITDEDIARLEALYCP